MYKHAYVQRYASMLPMYVAGYVYTVYKLYINKYIYIYTYKYSLWLMVSVAGSPTIWDRFESQVALQLISKDSIGQVT